ncbi:MAG: hypothetical protein KAX51_06740 [Chromatiaceae bacterium]|nr:hypothetical protein [Chromatiaceae bacterium]
MGMNIRPWEIYTLSDPLTLKVRYVGITFRGKRRLNEHLSRAVNGGKTHRDCWIRGLIASGMRPLFLVIEHGCGAGWQDAERLWITRFRESCDLVNHTDGGDGTPGCIPSPELRSKWSSMRAGVPYPPGRVGGMKGKNHTPEAREKIRQAALGRHHTKESKSKLSDAHQGKQLSEEHKKKLSAIHKGKVLTEEHKNKIAESTTGRKPVVCVETGEMYPSITAAAHALMVSESSVSLAIRKGGRCQGRHWKFQ